MPRIAISQTAVLALLAVTACGRSPGPPTDGAPAPAAAAATAPGSAMHPVIADFAARLAADVARDSVGSIAAAVVADGRVVWQGAFGVADAAAGVPATTGTIYRTGSLTKMVTAALLLRLVEAGVVGLDDAARKYVPEIERLAGRAPGSAPITLRQLATHTAGLAREPASSRAARGRFSDWGRKVLASIPVTEMVSAPGEAYLYSNIGYGILGLALERAAGRPFEDLVAALILDPLGMESSSFVVPGGDRPRLAAGYVVVSADSVDPRVPRAEHRGRGYRVPSEGLYSTVGDLSRLLLALLGHPRHPLLGETARATMLAVQTPRATQRGGYGLGLQLTSIGGTVLAGHSGRVAGYASYLVFDPGTGVGVVLLRNYNGGRTNLASDAQRLVLALTGPYRGRIE